MYIRTNGCELVRNHRCPRLRRYVLVQGAMVALTGLLILALEGAMHGEDARQRCDAHLLLFCRLQFDRAKQIQNCLSAEGKARRFVTARHASHCC